ncbi:hypothetical protein DWB85_04435 [Seongchinamella sediminis]|uniref:Uncharacterized protein n=1 Tax=Seongchinamella sediminis TaxID=2283635 RepID=A0A3L7E0C5_9GAMM|nr:hypothetical protein [Seongchinamella sediminis]RLQ23218.1 hypothetical protein DWB85_04435 [Seongchinamella sediminis]
MKTAAQLFLALTFSLNANLGQTLSYRDPPQFRVIDVVTDNQFIRVDNSRKVIEVRAADTLDLLWDIQLRRFYKWEYEIHLSRDGKYLFYFLPPTTIHDLGSTILEVYSRDGFITEYRVNEVLEELPTAENPCGGCAQHYWRGGYRQIHVYDDFIFVDLVDGQHARFWANEHRVLLGSYESKSS